MAKAGVNRRTGPIDHDIERFYRPRSIVVVGAHDTRPGLAGITEKAIEHVKRYGGTFQAVNPTKSSVFGFPCAASIAEVEGPVDVVVISVSDAIGVVEQATEAGLEVG